MILQDVRINCDVFLLGALIFYNVVIFSYCLIRFGPLIFLKWKQAGKTVFFLNKRIWKK